MDNLTSTLVIISGIALLFGVRVYAGHLDRERIREHVESHGGRVLDIAGNWNLFGSRWPGMQNARVYDVRYSTYHGRVVTATCATTMFRGVCWLNDAPPGVHDASETTQTVANLTAEERSESLATPVEEITCLACGAKMAARTSHCPKCGWSYTGN